jgi:SET domain-containing protein
MAQVAKYGDKAIKEYAFHLASGPDVMTNYAVYPQDFASAGFFINHSKSKNKINTKASIAIGESGPIILLQAIKKIDYGEELLYDYNGFYNSYETSNFK